MDADYCVLLRTNSRKRNVALQDCVDCNPDILIVWQSLHSVDSCGLHAPRVNKKTHGLLSVASRKRVLAPCAFVITRVFHTAVIYRFLFVCINLTIILYYP